MATWIQQQQEVVTPTLHREFYRRRLNARMELPSIMGIPTFPCDAGARYRRFAFTESDHLKKMEIRTDPATGRIVFYRDDQARTVVDATVLTVSKNGNTAEVEDGLYTICGSDPSPFLGSALAITYPGMGCQHLLLDGEKLGNPPVFFDDETQPSHPPINLDGYGFPIAGDDDFFATTRITEPNCDFIPPARGKPAHTTVGIYDGEYWLFDPRHKIETNTLQDPLPDGGANLVEQTRLDEDEMEDQKDSRLQVACSNPHMSFINENSCYLSYRENVCSSQEVPDILVDLVEDTFEKMYLATAELQSWHTRYVYAIEGLRQEPESIPYGSPCTPREMSRWIPTDRCNARNVRQVTRDLFADLLRASDDENPYLRDIIFPSTGVSCPSADVDKFDFAVEVDGQCWLNVHQMHLQVFDFSAFADQHDGGKEHIRKFANSTREDKYRLHFPDWHPMGRFHGWSEDFRVEVGRYGDTVRFSELPSTLLQEEIAISLGAVASLRNAGPTVVCGSPGEIANRERNAGNRHDGAFEAVDGPGDRSSEQRLEIWLAIALSADDQLRQRVAWALCQVLVISPGGLGASIYPETESWLVFYDIFVRHAFGNYRDILREVSYSPLMARMLTMMDNKSTDYLWRTRNRVEFADENYAREVMQLFSVGLLKLNNDGTVMRGANGQTFLTYTNSEITEYARVWTGFRRPPSRGNIEGNFGNNNIDPMRILPEWRDSFPKLGLDETYVGDGLPLCSDLPEKHFLRKGATYILLGALPSPQYHDDPSEWASDIDVVRPQLDSENSGLYEKLCGNEGGNDCSYPTKVVLDSDLDCFGIECSIQTPRIVEVGSGIFYEYLRTPCVYQAFFSDGQVVKKNWGDMYSCADPRLQTGGVGCCDDGSREDFVPTFDRFTGERVTFEEADRICTEAGLALCDHPKSKCQQGPCDKTLDYWSTLSCNVQAKISLEGTVAIVHDVPVDDDNHVLKQIRQYTKAFFRVVWDEPIEELLAEYDEMCDSLGCSRDLYDNLCLCTAEVRQTMVFSTAPSREQILNGLHFGAFPPDLEEMEETDLGEGVTMYSSNGSYTPNSIFEVIDNNGIKRYRKNLRSNVVIGSSNGLQLRFRNPTHTISIHDPAPLEAYQETEAALDHYFHHPNTAPFLAIRFAQRFGISNPTPRYIDRAATAFRAGRFIDEATGIRYGTGEYGNLAAMTAALLLDREARTVLLDADPTHGSLLEPFLRLVRMMKSLEFRAKADRSYVDLVNGMLDLIGEEPHSLPDVFSFFLPEFQPKGPVGKSGLVSPEAEVLTAPTIINLMNGLLSLVKYGLDSAFGGFGNGRGGEEEDRVLGRSNFADGDNRYRPTDGLSSAGIVDELATLLTSGRLSQEKRNLLQTVYEDYEGSHAAFINVQQLIATSPEFNTNGLSRTTDEEREIPEQAQASADRFKAVVEIYLIGGWDSFNVLVPEECSVVNEAGETVDEQYRSIRGELAMTPQEHQLHIDIDPADGQPCSRFAIHQDFPIAKELFDEGDLLFFANTGVINTAEMTKTNYEDVTVSKLFAHNFMHQEICLMDPYRSDPGTGLFGRMSEVLTARGYSTSGMSIDDPTAAMTPDSTAGAPAPVVVSRFGATNFNDRPEAEADFPLVELSSQLNAKTDLYSNVFGETWSAEYHTSVTQSNFLTDALATTHLGPEWNGQGNNKVATQLSMIARLLQTRETRGVDRDMYFVRAGFWDHHANMKQSLSNELTDLEVGLRSFTTELKTLGLWNDVTIVITSDFGRTLTMNGQEGSDHAWGGHYMMMGGDVKGGRILGQYPSDLTDNGPLSIGRGRFMPTTSWDTVFHGMSQWMGVENRVEMDEVLPNLHQTHGPPGFSSPFTASELFESNSAGSIR